MRYIMASARTRPTPDLLPVVHTPRTCGGRARLSGTRITVWVLESLRRQGASVSDILRKFPALKSGQVRSAWKYADEHADEIEEDIRDHEAA